MKTACCSIDQSSDRFNKAEWEGRRTLFRILRPQHAVIVAAALVFAAIQAATQAATVTVTGTEDTIAVDGLVTLREAVTSANDNANVNADVVAVGVYGTDTITFNIAGAGVHTIIPLADLPPITDPVIIDGYTQPGTSSNTLADADNAVLLIEISGASGNALRLLYILSGGSGSTVRGLVINRAPGLDGKNLHLQASNCVIEGNFIGTDVTGKNPLPNDGLGVSIVENATENVIKRNLIAFNMSDGIAVAFNATRNTVSQNSIFSNFDLGIDLGNGGPDDYHGDGVTYNDPGDADAGPNNLMNFPVLSSAIVLGSRLVVKGTIDTPNPSTVTIQFFANLVPSPGGDPSGYGEGAVFLGKIRPNKQGRFSTVLPKVPLGTLISATATDAQGNTSEFAANIPASR